MPAERYFIDMPFVEGEEVALGGDECHHLCTVMRARVGEEVELVNGRNQLAVASLQSMAKKSAVLRIGKVTNGKPSRPVIIAQAIPRFNRLETILEKGTELGATAFWLFPGMLSEKKEFSANQQERMRLIAISAMKQCGRLDLPAIEMMPPLSEWPVPAGTFFYGDTRPDAPLFDPKEAVEPIVFFVGPEKGFEQRELSLLEKKFQATGVKLHDNILRTDTASLVALSLVYRSGGSSPRR
jgi:16S rRNA (uracil1498-N3)-methyltransferase